MAKQLITVDPLTRIEGHLKIKVEIENGVVTNAYSSGDMFRGWEIILKGRNPLDAPPITQRICGVCPIPHGVSSVLALDDAFGIKPASNGRIIRNLLLGAEFVHSHLLHFYHLCALDYVDITAILQYSGLDPGLNKIKDWVKADIEAGLPGAGAPFLPRYKGDYIEDTETNIQAIASYVKALNIRRKSHEMLAIIGGKIPHCQTLFPGGAATILSLDRLIAFKSRLSEIRTFIDSTYIPDVLAIASLYPDYFRIGRGAGNFLSYGGFPVDDQGNNYYTSGVYIDGKLMDFDRNKISEYVKYSKYSSGSGLHPSEGDTIPDAKKPDAYSWIKAPRYDNKVLEVGPLARAMITYLKGNDSDFKALLDSALSALGAKPQDLISTMGRHAARALELKLLTAKMDQWIDQIDLSAPVHTKHDIPRIAEGAGLTEAARGSLGHWVSLDNWKIRNYQAVVPTTWNAGPRDDYGNMGPYEQALMGAPVADPDNPIELGRIIRSFDPCLACAVHVMEGDKEVLKFRIC
ncbi:MAG: nickel-dependent hydrogenase large subunit [Actinobacteria bacterium]|nr:nickel-dependent hydrogenase large subunit [Actinomycetota bacterium]